MTLYVQFCAPDDGQRKCLKHAEQFIEINRSRKRCVLLVYFRDILVMHGHMNVKKKNYYLLQTETKVLYRFNAQHFDPS